MAKRVTFEVSDDLHKKLKLYCYMESISLGQLLRTCVSEFLNQKDAHLIELVDNRDQDK